jgi:hypothetical protein
MKRGWVQILNGTEITAAFYLYVVQNECSVTVRKDVCTDIILVYGRMIKDNV